MTISMAICFIRLFNGPNVPNRTVSFDAIAVHAVGILTLYAIVDRVVVAAYGGLRHRRIRFPRHHDARSLPGTLPHRKAGTLNTRNGPLIRATEVDSRL